jgi:hypothetical protein
MHSPYEDEVDLHQIFMQAKNADFLQFRIVFWEKSDDDRGLNDVPPGSLSIALCMRDAVRRIRMRCSYDHR